MGGEGGGEKAEEKKRAEEEDAEYEMGSEPDEDETTIDEQEMFERQAAGSADRTDELDELNRESESFLSSLLSPSLLLLLTSPPSLSLSLPLFLLPSSFPAFFPPFSLPPSLHLPLPPSVLPSLPSPHLHSLSFTR